MIRILNAEPAGYCDEARLILQSIGELHEAVLSRDELIARLADYDVLVVRLGFMIDRPVLVAGTRLKAILTATTGLDHIDVRYARSKGIAVLSLQGERQFLQMIPATAEHTWALLLALVRRIPWAFQSVKTGHWDRYAYRGHDLYGKRLGIVGLGRLGERVARYGLAFGMEVAAYDPHRDDWPEDIQRYEQLDRLLPWADVVSLHVPLSEQTEGLIGAKELALMSANTILVNTARGALLDERALLTRLRRGKLAGAALDVLVGEHGLRSLEENPLIRYARERHNLLITPHLGGATLESMAATEVYMARKLRTFFESSFSLNPKSCGRSDSSVAEPGIERLLS